MKTVIEAEHELSDHIQVYVKKGYFQLIDPRLKHLSAMKIQKLVRKVLRIALARKIRENMLN
jgi:hypothetical protein